MLSHHFPKIAKHKHEKWGLYIFAQVEWSKTKVHQCSPGIRIESTDGFRPLLNHWCSKRIGYGCTKLTKHPWRSLRSLNHQQYRRNDPWGNRQSLAPHIECVPPPGTSNLERVMRGVRNLGNWWVRLFDYFRAGGFVIPTLIQTIKGLFKCRRSPNQGSHSFFPAPISTSIMQMFKSSISNWSGKRCVPEKPPASRYV